MLKKHQITALILTVFLLGSLTGCSLLFSQKPDSRPEPVDPPETSTAPEVEPPTEDDSVTEPLTEEEQLFISSLLAAADGEYFADTANLVDEKIAQILLNVPDIEFAASSPAKSFLDYEEETGDGGGTYYMVSDSDLEEASAVVFGRKVSAKQITALGFNPFVYRFGSNTCGRVIGNGHGGNFAVDIKDVRFTNGGVEVSYSMYDTNPYDPDREPENVVDYVAQFRRNDGQTKYPFRIISNLFKGESRSQEEIAVTKAYEQLMDFGLVSDRNDGSTIVMKLIECSFLRGFVEDDLYYPVADCYLLNLDRDPEPELIVESGQAETASYILDYSYGGFDVTMSLGHPLQKNDGGYYTVQAIPGDTDEGQIFYRIDPETLESEVAEKQSFSKGNYTYWTELDEYSRLTAVPTNEYRYFLIEDAVAAYYR